MPTIEGKAGQLWIDAYVRKAGKLAGVAKAVRSLVKKTATGCEEYVSHGRLRRLIRTGHCASSCWGKDM